MAHDYDVVVIGGGIHGAGVAQAAAARGHSVLVLEQASLAHGTSSRSSKLVHGGLRYLETGQLRLVRESLRERTLLARLVPGLVRIEPFYIPVYRASKRGPWPIRAGLTLYALLGGIRANSFTVVPRRDWEKLDGLETRDLLAVFRYRDGRTDDALLTRAVMASARSLDAELRMPARFEHAELDGAGCSMTFSEAGTTHTCRCRALVNAAGPWVDRVLAGIEPAVPKFEVELVRGTHILVPGTLACGTYYMETRDGRAVFAMPRRDGILVGTTEAVHTGDPEDVSPPAGEQRYLLETLSACFPKLGGPVVSAFAGLRVLPRGPGRAFDRPRETILGLDRPRRPRLVTVYGGKLTTYRATAEKVLDRLAAQLPGRARRGDTTRIPLDAGDAVLPF